eukprot:scaffold50378_cov70-Phaeocystis_antarctica.AAC.4
MHCPSAPLERREDSSIVNHHAEWHAACGTCVDDGVTRGGEAPPYEGVRTVEARLQPTLKPRLRVGRARRERIAEGRVGEEVGYCSSTAPRRPPPRLRSISQGRAPPPQRVVVAAPPTPVEVAPCGTGSAALTACSDWRPCPRIAAGRRHSLPWRCSWAAGGAACARSISARSVGQSC